jgi:hypothetical protein
LSAVDIQITGFLSMSSKNQAVQNAGFAGAVRTIDQRKGADGNVLRFCKSFEISDAYRGQHSYGFPCEY